MDWPEPELEELRDRLRGAGRDGLHIDYRAVTIFRTLIHRYLRAIGSRSPEGRLPTIGSLKEQGSTRFTVHCSNSAAYCHNQRIFTYDDIGLPDETIFIQIPFKRHFVCLSCGKSQVTLMAQFAPRPGTSDYRGEG